MSGNNSVNPLPLFQRFETCINYSILGILVSNTLTSMNRFKQIAPEEMTSKIYRTIKDRATRVADNASK